ncbi:MAG: S41 family peptidase [Candidatus Kryptoniota bacterium]
MKRKYAVILFVALLFTTAGFVGIQNADTFLQVKKSIDLFGSVYKDVIENYVDQIDPEQVMRGGINGMLSMLDPYTVYMDKTTSSEIDLLTTGKYGGVGISIGLSNGKIIITGVFDGYSAQRQGLRIGDQILKVDGKDVSKMKLDEVSNMVRGEPGTQIRMTIRREGETNPFEVMLVREEVRVHDVSYYGVVDSNIGFIKLDRFSRGADEEVRNALTDLMTRTNLKGLILDLRYNPGGLLESAVGVVELFVPKGSLIVMTKGRAPSADKKYISDVDPVAPNLPLVVLVNENSASASEIVAGALQDLDRAVVVGTNTYGKGLVQTILPLGYDAELKITTAKYYTPSGRCIQKINYEKKRDGESDIIPDSLRKEFHTIDGRPVFEAGGIQPDSVVMQRMPSDYVVQLMRENYFFNFATEYRNSHDSIPANFAVNEKVLNEFKNYLDRKNFSYNSRLSQLVKDAELYASRSNYSPAINRQFDKLYEEIKQDESALFEKNQKEIARLLQTEIVGRFKGSAAQIEQSLNYDNQVKAAEEILKSTGDYQKILGLVH